jgi:hypothetical protein
MIVFSAKGPIGMATCTCELVYSEIEKYSPASDCYAYRVTILRNVKGQQWNRALSEGI